MANPIFGLGHRKPGSLAQLSQFTKGWNDQKAGFLLPLAFQDIFFKWYDFDNDTITTDWTANESAAPATVFAANTANEYGTAAGAVAATSNQTISYNYDGVWFDANHSPGMIVRLQYDVVTTMYLEVGFSDAPTQPYTINWALDTPTLQSNGTTDVATVVIDSSATQKTATLCAVGTTDTTAAKKVLSAHGSGYDTGGAVSNYDVPGTNPMTAATYMTVLLQINSAASATAGANSVSACIDGNPVLSGTVNAGLDTAVALRPYIICGTRSAAAKNFKVDYIGLWCNRQ